MSGQRLVVGISGSSGAILGIRLLEALRSTPIETHLVVTPAARLTIEQETDWKIEAVLGLASVYYQPDDLAAAIASGSYDTMGMIVIPCSIKSLSAIANSYSGDLLTRAADVTLKEGRPLLLVVRETPLHAGHIDLMSRAARNGAILFPPVPAFYAHPISVDHIVSNIVGRVLRRMGIANELYMQWQGPGKGLAQGKENSQAGPLSPSIDEYWDLPSMTLATVGPDGSPHAAVVNFVADEPHQNLYFFCAPDSQHSLDMSANPQAAAEIHPPVESWQVIRGLQMRGQVRPIPPGEEWQQARDRYLVKFPFAGERNDIHARNTLYAFHPDWIRWIDNRAGFDHNEEWTPD